MTVAGDEVNPPELAVKLYEPSSAVKLRPLKVATPLLAASEAVPVRVPPDMVKRTIWLVGTTLLLLSSIVTATVPNEPPPLASDVVGPVVKTSLAGVPAARVSAEAVAESELSANLRVKLPVVPVRVRPLKVASPEALVVAVTFESVAPDPETMVAVMTSPFTGLDFASTTLITGCVVKATPLTAPEGWVWTLKEAGTPAPSVNDEVVIVAAPEVKVSVKDPAVPERERPLKVAIPEASVVAVAVPLSVIELPVTVTVTVAPLTGLPLTSVIMMEGWVVKFAPLEKPAGAVVMVAVVAAPNPVTVMGAEAAVRPVELATSE